MEKFKKRRVRYLDKMIFDDWQFKIYNIKYNEETDTPNLKQIVKKKLPNWIKEKSQINDFPNHKIGTLIIHEAKDTIIVVVNWWVYENVIQNHVYISNYSQPDKFNDYSSRGIQFCVWEMNIIWFERNLWVQHILKKSHNPDWQSYMENNYQLEYAE